MRPDPTPNDNNPEANKAPGSIYDFDVKCFDTVNNRNLAMSRTYTEIQSYKMPANVILPNSLVINRPSLDNATATDVEGRNRGPEQCFVIEYTAGSLTGPGRKGK